MSRVRRRQASPEVSEGGGRGGGSGAAPLTMRTACACAVEWSRTGDALTPWRATVGDHAWTLRLNDFPQEPLYTLFVDRAWVGELNDWPKAWSKNQ